MPQDLIVVGFKGAHRAAEVLTQLQRLRDQWTIDLSDAVAAYRTDDGSLRIDRSAQPTASEGADWSVLLGGMLGALIAAPVAGTANAAATSSLAATPPASARHASAAAAANAANAPDDADDANAWKQRYGIPDEFVSDVGGMIQPGESAVFALIRSVSPDLVAEKFRGFGGRILRASLAATARHAGQAAQRPLGA